MSLTYPLTPPAAPTVREMSYRVVNVVGFNKSPYTGQQQAIAWPGQWWEVDVELPPLENAAADEWLAFLLALQGRLGTFYFGPSTKKTNRGGVTGTAQVGAGVPANGTGLVTKTHSGTFAVGDWLQIGATTAAKLHRVVKVNSQYSYDIFPRTRSAYADGTSITYTNPVGLFRLATNQAEWSVNLAHLTGLRFSAQEAL